MVSADLICKTCDEGFNNLGSFLGHTVLCMQPPSSVFICTVCNLFTNKKFIVDKHCLMQHNGNGQMKCHMNFSGGASGGEGGEASASSEGAADAASAAATAAPPSPQTEGTLTKSKAKQPQTKKSQASSTAASATAANTAPATRRRRSAAAGSLAAAPPPAPPPTRATKPAVKRRRTTAGAAAASMPPPAQPPTSAAAAAAAAPQAAVKVKAEAIVPQPPPPPAQARGAGDPAEDMKPDVKPPAIAIRGGGVGGNDSSESDGSADDNLHPDGGEDDDIGPVSPLGVSESSFGGDAASITSARAGGRRSKAAVAKSITGPLDARCLRLRGVPANLPASVELLADSFAITVAGGAGGGGERRASRSGPATRKLSVPYRHPDCLLYCQATGCLLLRLVPQDFRPACTALGVKVAGAAKLDNCRICLQLATPLSPQQLLDFTEAVKLKRSRGVLKSEFAIRELLVLKEVWGQRLLAEAEGRPVSQAEEAAAAAAAAADAQAQGQQPDAAAREDGREQSGSESSTSGSESDEDEQEDAEEDDEEDDEEAGGGDGEGDEEDQEEGRENQAPA